MYGMYVNMCQTAKCGEYIYGAQRNEDTRNMKRMQETKARTEWNGM